MGAAEVQGAARPDNCCIDSAGSTDGVFLYPPLQCKYDGLGVCRDLVARSGIYGYAKFGIPVFNYGNIMYGGSRLANILYCKKYHGNNAQAA